MLPAIPGVTNTVSLHIINWLKFTLKPEYVFCEVGTDFLNIIYMKLML